MAVLYVLLPVALTVVLGALVLFVWAARSGQFDDLSTPPRRMLLDEDPPRSDLDHESLRDRDDKRARHGAHDRADC